MEGKVLLYDANGTKIGETFTRRARQLVNQQRAEWVDDRQEALRFFPGAENSELSETVDPGLSHDTDAGLMRLARRRVILRTVYKGLWMIYFAVNAFLIFIWLSVGDGIRNFWPGWVMGGWGLALIIVGIVFKLVSALPSGFNSEIESEYNKLKNR